MKRRFTVRPVLATLFVALSVLTASVGVDCPPDDGTAPFNPPVAPGDKAPRIQITRVDTPLGTTSVQEGDEVVIAFSADSGDFDQTAAVSIFASLSPNPSLNDPTTIPIPIRGGNNVIGPGTGSGEGTWDTTGVASGSYNLFAEIDDGVNSPVRVTALSPLGVAPMGTQPATKPPELEFLDPVANLGLSSDDEITIRYIYADTDSEVTVTLLLDKDLDPTNDNILFPGDPSDPDIIVLPSTARLISDPTFDGDPQPPDDPANPPAQPDSVQIRTNPRTLPMTSEAVFPFPGAPVPGELKEYRFVIDFTQIPPRSQPVFLRADLTDGQNSVSRYAVGSITINRLAEGTVDVQALGFSLAGARFQGFSEGENLGTDFVNVTDLDGDSQDEFMIAGRFASPRFRDQSGAAYLIFGRRKNPFPADTDMDGLPDGGVQDNDGNIVNFPAPPDFDGDGVSEFEDPYESRNVGRFGGVVSINSVGSFFRGEVYGMPEAHGFTPPPPGLFDANHPNVLSAGLSSIARVDMTDDGVPDLFFGLAYVSASWDYIDDDPADGCGDMTVPYLDARPNQTRCDGAQSMPNPRPTNDDLVSVRQPPVPGFNEISQGMVIMVDGTNDLASAFSVFLDAGMAGQFDPAGPIDDEGVILSEDLGQIPAGMRFRGGWFDPLFFIPVPPPPPPDAPAFFAFFSDNEYGRTVARMPEFTPGSGDLLLISSPGFDPLFLNPDPQTGIDPADIDRGGVQVFVPNNFLDTGFYGGPVLSLPSYSVPQGGNSCTGADSNICARGLLPLPVVSAVIGEQPGDRFGFAQPAGDFNQDGPQDLLAGAGGADRNGLTDNGKVYIIQGPAGGFGDIDLATENVPRVEIIGTHNDDRFGEVQASVQDMNGDGIDDVAFASQSFDVDLDGDGSEEADVGYVGVIFGDRPITGVFSPDDVATQILPGVRFVGVSPGALAGHDISSAGDFNSDNVGDLLITSPGEVRVVNGQQRQGVAYLIFGGTHLLNQSFNLSQVGSPALPGMVFISRFELGTVDEAALEFVGGIGDTDGDGFDDIMISAPTADFVNLASPNQRRLDAGEVYMVYGNNFGSNNCTTFPNPCSP